MMYQNRKKHFYTEIQWFSVRSVQTEYKNKTKQTIIKWAIFLNSQLKQREHLHNNK